MSRGGGDLYLARDFLEKVAGSNAEDVTRASDLLKTVKSVIQDQEQKAKDVSVDMEAGVAKSSTLL
jgi:anaphase-promoting complex subunit 8